MNYRILGAHIEYVQAAKRLEEIANAQPGTLQARERAELIRLFIEFEKEVQNQKNASEKNPKISKKKKITLYLAVNNTHNYNRSAGIRQLQAYL